MKEDLIAALLTQKNNERRGADNCLTTTCPDLFSAGVMRALGTSEFEISSNCHNEIKSSVCSEEHFDCIFS